MRRSLILATLVCSLLPGQSWRHRQGERSRPPMLESIQREQVARLQRSLGLSEERADQLAQRWMRWIWDSSAQIRKTRQLRRQMEELLLRAGSDEEKNAAIKPLLEEFLALRHSLQVQRQTFEEEIRAGLSPVQQARLISMIDDFQRRLHEGMREATRGRERRSPN